MSKYLLLILALLTIKTAKAQLHADFHCIGNAFDQGCDGFGDASNPGTSVIVSRFWDFGNGTTLNGNNTHPVDVCYDSLGYYTVCLTVYDANGDSSQTCKQNYVFVDSIGKHCNAIADVSEFANSKFEFYPNPVTTEFTFKVNNSESSEIFLYDNISRIVLRQTFKSSITLNLTEFSQGLYVFTIQNRNGAFYIGKVVKE